MQTDDGFQQQIERQPSSSTRGLADLGPVVDTAEYPWGRRTDRVQCVEGHLGGVESCLQGLWRVAVKSKMQDCHGVF